MTNNIVSEVALSYKNRVPFNQRQKVITSLVEKCTSGVQFNNITISVTGNTESADSFNLGKSALNIQNPYFTDKL